MMLNDNKGLCGIGGLNQQKTMLVHWTITMHIVGSYAATTRNHSGLSEGESVWIHEESKLTAITSNEQTVATPVQHLQEYMTPPLDIDKHTDGLVNISTGPSSKLRPHYSM